MTGPPRRLNEHMLSRQARSQHTGLIAKECGPRPSYKNRGRFWCWVIGQEANEGHRRECHLPPEPDPGRRVYVCCDHMGLPESAFYADSLNT